MAKTEVLLGKRLAVHNELDGLNQGDFIHLSKEENDRLLALSKTSKLINDGSDGESTYVENDELEVIVKDIVEADVPFTRRNALIRVDSEGRKVSQSKVDVTDNGTINIPSGEEYLIGGLPVTGDVRYRFSQVVPESTWNINHNLGKFPAVIIMDYYGVEYESSIKHTDINNLTISFSNPFSGYADLN